MIMKRFWIILLLALLSAWALNARDQQVRDVNIRMTIIKNGNVVFHERWDVDTGDRITEWYLNRENLGDITISRFHVYDGEDGKLEDDGEWEVNRSREEKAGRYGIVHKSNGVELCWGVGEYGDHEYHAVYVMERAVKTLNDYDMLHLQVVSDGLSAPPQHVRVEVRTAEEGVQLDTTNTRIWGFGYTGQATFTEEGSVVFESDQPLDTDDSVIILLRFEKGLFISPSVQDRSFQEVWDQAKKGSSYRDQEEEDPIANALALIVTALVMWFVFLRPLVKIFLPEKKLSLGFNAKKAPWYREIPMKGDLRMAAYILRQSGNEPSSGGLPLATILRLIHQGYMQVTREVDGPAVLSFTDKDISQADSSSRGLYKLLKAAAGADKLLQDKEFSRWAEDHARQVEAWSDQARRDGVLALQEALWYKSGKEALTAAGQEEARRLFGLKSFLSAFTLVGEREAFEANLWKEYMVYGALFGITDRVAKQLKDIDPALFRETFHYDMADFDTVMATSASFSRAVSQAIAQSAAARAAVYSSSSSDSSCHGYGGHSSRGGGGGFSGGGRGGGGR